MMCYDLNDFKFISASYIICNTAKLQERRKILDTAVM
jgi:hypothetical protein